MRILQVHVLKLQRTPPPCTGCLGFLYFGNNGGYGTSFLYVINPIDREIPADLVLWGEEDANVLPHRVSALPKSVEWRR